MATEYELTVNDYLSILRRRWPQIAAIFTLVLLAAIALAVLLPSVYESKGTILVESQQIPTDLVQASVTTFADERIEVIKQRVMTRDNLYRIIDKYKLYQDQRDEGSTSEVLDEMRDAIHIQLLSANNANSYEKKATIAFTVAFEYARPEIAHKVANEIVTLFLDENVKARTERATETTAFLGEEVNNIKKDLEITESKVAEFKAKHADSLPEHMDMHMSMLQRSEMDIKEIDRDYKATQEELRYLDVELASARSGINRKFDNSPNAVVSQDNELEKTKLELERALALYKESHPTVKLLQRKLEKLEQSAMKDSASQDTPKAKKPDIEVDLMVAKVQAQIDSAKVRLNSLNEQKKSLRQRVDQLQNQLTRSPEVERGLFTLMRDYENAKAKYDEVKSKHLNAKIAENLEQENKAERFAMLEPPMFPDKPIKPDRKKVVALGLLGALASALGSVFLLEVVNARVRGTDALTAVTKMRTLSTIPYIYTQAEIRRKKYFYRYLILGILGLSLLVLLVLHFLVMPLDLLIVKIFTRFA